MAFKILVLGASYGSLFGTKCAMAGHDVTLVCRSETAELINRAGTVVRMKMKGEQDSPLHSIGGRGRDRPRVDTGHRRTRRLRSRGACDAGTAIRPSHHPAADGEACGGARPLPVADEHAACSVSEAACRSMPAHSTTPSPTFESGTASIRRR